MEYYNLRWIQGDFNPWPLGWSQGSFTTPSNRSGFAHMVIINKSSQCPSKICNNLFYIMCEFKRIIQVGEKATEAHMLDIKLWSSYQKNHLLLTCSSWISTAAGRHEWTSRDHTESVELSQTGYKVFFKTCTVITCFTSVQSTYTAHMEIQSYRYKTLVH